MRRLLAAALLSVGSLVLTANPAAAKDSAPFYGPLEVRIVGANGQIQTFIARSQEDAQGADELVKQISGGMHEPAGPIEEAAMTLPHYRVGITHLAVSYPTMPWARMPETEFIYYPGGDGSSFLMVEFSPENAVLQERWIEPAPAVKAMLQRHLNGLPPIGSGLPSVEPASSPPWGVALGVVLLAALSMLFFEDRRRWRRANK